MKKDQELIGEICWLKVLSPYVMVPTEIRNGRKFYDPMFFIIVKIENQFFFITKDNLNIYKVKKSEVEFEDRVRNTIPQEFKNLI